MLCQPPKELTLLTTLPEVRSVVTQKFPKFDDLNLSVFKNVDGRKVLAESSLKAFKCRNIDQNSTDSY